MFDWKLASIDECANEMVIRKPQDITALIAHYRKTNNEIMLTKLHEARRIAKLLRAIRNGFIAEQSLLSERCK
jgi:hypothetical protein